MDATNTKKKTTVTYGSAGYSILCYAKMVNRPFKSKECLSCIPGQFSGSVDPAGSFWSSACTLEKNGLMRKVEKGVWQITDAGKREIIESVSIYRMRQTTEFGQRYMTNYRERMAKASNYIFGLDNEALDEEEKLLIEIEDKMRRRNAKRRESAKKRASRG